MEIVLPDKGVHSPVCIKAESNRSKECRGLLIEKMVHKPRVTGKLVLKDMAL